MKFLILLPYLLFLSIKIIAQDSYCRCADTTFEYQKSKQVFKLKRSVSLAVCGYIDNNKNPRAYSEFILFQCGQAEIIGEWGSQQTCTIRQVKDSLFITELYGLPNGKNFSIKWQGFYISKYYFKVDQIVEEKYFNTGLKKYTTAEIGKVLTQFQQLKKPVQDYKQYLIIINRLFWAYVSGSKDAGKYLEKLQLKDQHFDGAIAEEFNEIITDYKIFKQQQFK